MGRAMNDTDRSSRLKAALRENLKRRKAQSRGRETDKNNVDHPALGAESPDEPKCGAGPAAAPRNNSAEADEE